MLAFCNKVEWHRLKGANKNKHRNSRAFAWKLYKWYLMCYLNLVRWHTHNGSRRFTQFVHNVQCDVGYIDAIHRPHKHSSLYCSQSWFTYEVINFWLMCDERHQCSMIILHVKWLNMKMKLMQLGKTMNGIVYATYRQSIWIQNCRCEGILPNVYTGYSFDCIYSVSV